MSSAPSLVIAEAGVNHNGDLDLAKALVDAAADAGADLVKFQTFAAQRVVTKSAGKADYQRRTSEAAETQYAMLRRLELSESMHHTLLSHCRERGLGFLSSGFDLQSVDFLAGLGLDCLKVPSGEMTNVPYLRHVGRLGKKVILSTGMSTLGEIESALAILAQNGTPRKAVTVLHCNSEYPTSYEDVNLRAMQTIGQAFDVAVGYSDHTPGIEVPIAAVALGASVIEKHLTLDRGMSGPDHAASLEPGEFEAMVQAIRHIESALGDGLKRPSPSESRNRPIARKSIVAAKVIRKGELFTEQNLTVKRPANGLSPLHWDDLLGRTAARDYEPDQPIEL